MKPKLRPSFSPFLAIAKKDFCYCNTWPVVQNASQAIEEPRYRRYADTDYHVQASQTETTFNTGCRVWVTFLP